MSLLLELLDLREKAVYKNAQANASRVSAEWNILIQSLREFPLLSFSVWEQENAERAKNEGLTVRYSGDIIPQWKISIPD